MKKNIIIAVAIFAACTQVFAQEKNNGWQERKAGMEDKIKSEKIAFITTELNISSEESADFWAVYNPVDKKKSEAMWAVKKATFALKKAVKENQDITKALDAYNAAITARNEAEKEALETYRKSFGDEKAAKLAMAEEKFIQFQLFKLNGDHGNHGPAHKPGEGQKPQMGQGKNGDGQQQFRRGQQFNGQQQGRRPMPQTAE